jgi:hypothetical protein
MVSAVCLPARCPLASGQDSESALYPSFRHWSVCMYQYAVPIMVRGGRVQSRALASEIQPVIGRHFSCPT